MVATLEVSPVCSPLSTRGRPTTLVPLMDAVMDSSGALPLLTLRPMRNILSAQRRMVSMCFNVLKAGIEGMLKVKLVVDNG